MHLDNYNSDLLIIFSTFLFTVDYISAPFCVSKSNIYEGIKNPDFFFRPALRSLLVRKKIELFLVALYSFFKKKCT